MKIEFVERIEDAASNYTNYNLSIDGIVDTKSFFIGDDFHVKNRNTLKQLEELNLIELNKYFNILTITVEQEVTDWKLSISLSINNEPTSYGFKTNRPQTALLEILLDPKEWDKSYSIYTLEDIYKKYTDQQNHLKYSERSEYHGATGVIVVPINNRKKKLKEIISELKNIYEDISRHVLEDISKLIAPDLLTTLFEFPEELKTACKLYLVYFGQFLADMGINADTSIKEEANKVLFTVIPKDGNDALDRIKEALEVYMNVPGMQDIEVIQLDEPKDIALMQWEANVHHLRGQVTLAQATLQAKDATIDALQLSNYILAEKLTEIKQIESKPDKQKEEKVAGGIVSVRKYEGKFFSIDLPALIRKLKRKK